MLLQQSFALAPADLLPIGIYYLGRLTDLHHRPAVYPHNLRAPALHRLQVVRDEHDRLPLALEFLDLGLTLVAESFVSDRENLVYQ